MKFYVAAFKSPNDLVWYTRPQTTEEETKWVITTVSKGEKFLGIQEFEWKENDE